MKKALRNHSLTVLLALMLMAVSFLPLMAQAVPGVGTGPAGATGAGDHVDAESGLQFSLLAGWLYTALTTIGSLFAYVGGELLDISLSWFVMDMKGTSDYFGISEAIKVVWALVRDLFNILFIFSLIFIGFKIILGIDDSGAKRNLGTIVLAAILINFSLFAVQIVVDFGNIAAVEVSELLGAESEGEVGGLKVSRIADSFVAATSIKNLGTSTLEMAAEAIEGDITLVTARSEYGIADALILGLSMALMLMLLGFVFAAGALLMFTRFMYLLYLMMFSPILVLGWILPSFKKRSSDWWGNLLKQTMMGPAYLFMLYISLLALEQTDQIQSDKGLMAFVILSVIVCGFAWASLIIAKSMGAVGASQAMSMGKSMGNRVRGYAGSASFGAAAAAMRNTFGRQAQQRLEKGDIQEAVGRRGVRGWVARRQMSAYEKAADSSFDGRKVGGLGKKLGIGEGRKGGYKTATEEVAKKEKAYAARLGEVDKDDPRVARLQMDVDASDLAIKDKKDQIANMRKELGKLPKDQQEKKRGEIEAARVELEELEEKKKKSVESLTAEKQRRQLGTRAPAVPKGLTTEQINKMDKEIDDEIVNLKKDAVAAGNDGDFEKQKKLIQQISEKKVTKAKTKKEREEFRSSSKAHEVASDIADLKNEIKSSMKDYAKADTDARRDEIAKSIADKQAKLKEKEKEANSLGGGYATTVAEFGLIKNFIVGRNRKQNENAADEIRKEYQKKVKGEDKK